MHSKQLNTEVGSLLSSFWLFSVFKKNQEIFNQIIDTVKKRNKKKYPNKSDSFLIVHPHFDNYDDHIFIVNDFYIDKASKKGNFTIGACLLNRKFQYVGWEPNVVDENKLLNDLSDIVEEPDKEKRTLKLDAVLKNAFSY